MTIMRYFKTKLLIFISRLDRDVKGQTYIRVCVSIHVFIINDKFIFVFIFLFSKYENMTLFPSVLTVYLSNTNRQ